MTEANPLPRLLEIDLTGLEPGGAVSLEPRAYRPRTRAHARVAGWGGPALGLVWMLERADESAPALVVSVGEGVRRGLPTAARATLLARSPLTGRVATGQVGSGLAARLASVADTLVVHGRARAPGAVLHVAGGGRVELLSRPALAGADPGAVQRVLAAELGPCDVLRCGPAGENGVRFANLAVGAEPPSFVGRGGLGAVLGALGLKAIAVTGTPVEPDRGAGKELSDLLSSSPRLRARAEGGTLELIHAFGARGELHRERGALASGEQARALGDEAEHAAKTRFGCKGCPTPCGWAFEVSANSRPGARFSAVYALGLSLGLDGLEDPLVLLDDCNRLGLDAKESGAVLAALARAVEENKLAGPGLWGERERLRAALADVALGRGLAAAREGAAAVERALGLAASDSVRGEAGRRERNLASVLGQCVGSRGAEPMRTFPFLAADGASRERLAQLLAPTPVPEGTEDPRDPTGKGRLVWWHENLVTAIDATGFCAFSAAGLLTDGLCDVDALARAVAPASMCDLAGAASPGQSLLAAGASLTLLFRELDQRWGGPPLAPPEWARAEVERPGMLAEYRRYRGLDAGEVATAAVRARLATGALADPPEGADREAREDGAPRARSGAPARAAGIATPGIVRLNATGPLGRALGAERAFRTELPAPLGEVLGRLAREVPGAAEHLVRGADPVPAVYREGQRLRSTDEVAAGDRLDLIVAVAGG